MPHDTRSRRAAIEAIAPRSSLLTLPPEVRQVIYDHVMGPADVIHLAVRSNAKLEETDTLSPDITTLLNVSIIPTTQSCTGPSVLRTCKLIYAEFSHRFSRNCRICIMVLPSGSSPREHSLSGKRHPTTHLRTQRIIRACKDITMLFECEPHSDGDPCQPTPNCLPFLIIWFCTHPQLKRFRAELHNVDLITTAIPHCCFLGLQPFVIAFRETVRTRSMSSGYATTMKTILNQQVALCQKAMSLMRDPVFMGSAIDLARYLSEMLKHMNGRRRSECAKDRLILLIEEGEDHSCVVPIEDNDQSEHADDIETVMRSWCF